MKLSFHEEVSMYYHESIVSLISLYYFEALLSQLTITAIT